MILNRCHRPVPDFDDSLDRPEVPSALFFRILRLGQVSTCSMPTCDKCVVAQQGNLVQKRNHSDLFKTFLHILSRQVSSLTFLRCASFLPVCFLPHFCVHEPFTG
jgi:hypothetical protein